MSGGGERSELPEEYQRMLDDGCGCAEIWECTWEWRNDEDREQRRA